MAYIETIKKEKKNYYYLTQTIRLGKKFKKVRRLLGKGHIPQQKLKTLADTAEQSFRAHVKEIKTTRNILTLSKEQSKRLTTIKKNYKNILASLSPVEHHVLEKDHLIRFTFNTNALEGSTITLKETAHILEDHIVPASKDLREVHEIENTKKAYELVKQYKKTITTSFIKQIHYRLTFNVLEEQAGVFRRIQVYMGGSKHTPTKAKELSKEMSGLIHWIGAHKDLDRVVVAMYVHHFFIAIHPFIDGNGRTGRLLLNFMLMTAGFPLICINKEEKIRYIDSLEGARDGDLTMLLGFIIEKIEDAYQTIVDNTK